MSRLSPSHWLRGLLARVLGPAEQDALGDLEEEFHGRIRPNARWAVAECWYVLEALSLFFAVARGRLSLGRGSDPRTSDITSGDVS